MPTIEIRPVVNGCSSALTTILLVLLSVEVPAAVLEEIVVTARKREQQLSDVGISVTAFTGEQMKALGVSSTLDLDNQTPGLLVTGFSGGGTTVFNIRGAGQLDFNDQQESPVAVFLDGAYVSWLAGVGFNFYDLERIEVLRGSQGTLFGRNATAGLVHIISAKPTDNPEGYVEASGGDYGMVKVEGAISGPLTESLKGRLSMYYENNNGYVENLGPGDDHHDIDNYSGRAQLLFEPNDKLSVHVSGRWAIDDNNSEAFHKRRVFINADGLMELASPAQHFDFCTNVFPLPSKTPVFGATNCYGYFEDGDPFTIERDFDTFFKRDHYGITGTINYETDLGTITSITDWQDLKKRYAGDSDSTPATLFHFFQDMDGNQFSQELRFAGETDRARWLVGAYYLNIDTDGRAGVDAIGNLGVGIDDLYSLGTTTYAFFGQAEYDFSAAFTGIAGIRWTEDEKEYSFTPRCTFLPDLAGVNTANCAIFAPLVQGSALPKLKRDEGDWSGHIELDWHATDDILVYGKISRGHKAGGVNGGIVSFFLADELTYDAETPLTYEGGFKARLFEGKASLSASLFFIDYKDFQAFTSRPGIGLVVFNNDSEILGSEIELALKPWEGWDFLFGLSLLDGEAQDLLGEGGQFDREMANAPNVSFNALGHYEWAAFGGRMAAQIDMNYVDDRALEAENHPALAGSDYVVANASVQWTSANDKWLLKLWVKNFTDEVYFPTSFSHLFITGMTQHVVAEPRWFGGTVGYRW